MVIKEFNKLAKSKKVKEDDNIKDLEIDSLDFAELIINAEEKFEIQLPDSELTNLVTVNDVILLIEKTKNTI
ncbi:acyl carrier protein [Mycoplasmopsis anatis]|uniref:Acyl carrier protein n=2 Tax=Mycoplasmopsis anatis TaxID=171279 RepID=A0A9Q3L8C3_9BACT|nr:acyl carrier protein [Mycoplasmopsis anatis]MBW0595342.1 acyl carrier protein [Mycoplasmopsis anatis]MBW0596285.1 acyl carrier protein [Mycoplasmopsis anatis]MBW0596465.1 acyl carrier protein [Mycoplasmopsis anatis]MBW0597784.1 acyl carrier protein [Mycoplasmopsis anatis]